MSPKVVSVLKIAAAVLIGMCVVILLSANKITSSIVLTLTAVVILLPSKSELLKWCRIAFVLAALIFVLRNISTTEYLTNCYNTGVRFFDQVLYLFDQFLQNTFDTSIVDPQCRPTGRPLIE